MGPPSSVYLKTIIHCIGRHTSRSWMTSFSSSSWREWDIRTRSCKVCPKVPKTCLSVWEVSLPSSWKSNLARWTLIKCFEEDTFVPPVKLRDLHIAAITTEGIVAPGHHSSIIFQSGKRTARGAELTDLQQGYLWYLARIYDMYTTLSSFASITNHEPH